MTKYMSMGRLALELAYVMPDEKTVYLTDDGTNVVFVKYVADAPKNLDGGTLYCAKFTQTSPDAGAASGFDSTIEWIDMGHAAQDDLVSKVETTKFQVSGRWCLAL